MKPSQMFFNLTCYDTMAAAAFSLNSYRIVAVGGSFNCHIAVVIKVGLKHGLLVLELHHYPSQD